MPEKKANEIDAWTVAVGNVPALPPFLLPKKVKGALEVIGKLEGMLGVHPEPPRGTLLLFKSKNDAIRAKNVLMQKGIQTGKNICHCYVDKKYLRKEYQDESTRSDIDS